MIFGSYAAARQWLKKNDPPQLGHGLDREVYDLGDGTVLKIEPPNRQDWRPDTYGSDANGDPWLGQCMQEWRVWQRANKSQRRWLATLYEGGQGWVVQEKAELTLAQHPDYRRAQCHHWELNLRRCCRRGARYPKDMRVFQGLLTRWDWVGDAHDDNIGLVNGQWKLIDSGMVGT